ncbi:MAG: ATP-binding cassette domain-containing protein [Cyanobacteria bacterium NC_groundwater_1444_Ag_S-0.65um_54_12]|nr:ATP-binding cassette domain-containing protein [Cyanobacteria bacterium NC_groundwater_1444_Ag_S-0.65um_54_12]
MIAVENLSKLYGDRIAVDDVSFTVKKGEVLGFLGPNGAGKSTTMRMITGYLAPSAGKITVGGFEVKHEPLKTKALIGYLPEIVPLYPEMSVRDYLKFIAAIKGIPGREQRERIAAIIRRCWLTEYADRLIAHLSKGYRQRLGLAQALIHNPPVLILDEPTSGLDPKQILETRELIRSLAGDHTVVLSTHILPEVQNVCSRVLIINAGKVVAEDAPERLEAKLKGAQTIHLEVRAPQDKLTVLLAGFPGVRTAHAHPKGQEFPDMVAVDLDAEPGDDMRARLAAAVINAGWDLLELRAARLSLEEIFLKLTTDEVASPAEIKEVASVQG